MKLGGEQTMTNFIAWTIAIAAIIGLGFGHENVAKLFGFSETQITAAQELRQHLSGKTQKTIDNGDITIQQYEKQIQEVKDKLIRAKVIRKTYAAKLQTKQTELADIEKSQPASEQIKLLRESIQNIESFLIGAQQIEEKLETTLKKMVTQLEITKSKIETLKTKSEILKIQTEFQEYSKLESDIKINARLIEKATEDLMQTIYTLQAQQEIEQQLHKLESTLVHK